MGQRWESRHGDGRWSLERIKSEKTSGQSSEGDRRTLAQPVKKIEGCGIRWKLTSSQRRLYVGNIGIRSSVVTFRGWPDLQKLDPDDGPMVG